MKKLLIPTLFILFCINAFSQQRVSEREIYNATIESFDLLKELLAIPNDANHPEDILKNIEWVESHMGNLGFSSQRLETETVPLVLATYKTLKPNQETKM